MNDHPENQPQHPDQEPDSTPADHGNEPCNPPAATPGPEPIGSDTHPAASPDPDTGSDDNSPESPDQLAENGLTEDDNHRVEKLSAKAVAPNTRLNYNYQWNRYTAWARDRGIEPLPRRPGTRRRLPGRTRRDQSPQAGKPCVRQSPPYLSCTHPPSWTTPANPNRSERSSAE